MDALSDTGYPLVKAAAPLYAALDPAVVHETMVEVLLDGIARQAGGGAAGKGEAV